MASVLDFNVTDLVNYFDTENPTDPDPAPGEVTADLGNGKYKVEIALADGSTDEVIAGAQEPAVDPDPSPSVRWIALRDREAD